MYITHCSNFDHVLMNISTRSGSSLNLTRNLLTKFSMCRLSTGPQEGCLNISLVAMVRAGISSAETLCRSFEIMNRHIPMYIFHPLLSEKVSIIEKRFSLRAIRPLASNDPRNQGYVQCFRSHLGFEVIVSVNSKLKTTHGVFMWNSLPSWFTTSKSEAISEIAHLQIRSEAALRNSLLRKKYILAVDDHDIYVTE